MKVKHSQLKSRCVKLFYVVYCFFFLLAVAVCVIAPSKLCIFLSDSHFQGHACSLAPCGYGQV